MKSADEDKTLWFRTEGGEPGPMGVAVAASLADVVLSGPQYVTAELARQTAELVDAARREQDARVWLSAATRLDQLMRRLGLGDSGDGGDDGGLAEALGASPSVGDREVS